MNGYDNAESIYDDEFAWFYHNTVFNYIQNISRPHLDWSGFNFNWMDYNERKRKPIPKNYQRVYELYKKINDVFKNTENIQEILCPDLVRVIASKDFYKKFGNSFNKNKKLCPEKLFKEYRKDNTKSADTSIDL